MYNCICYYNSATTYPNFYSGTMYYCCATPMPLGSWNITNEPLFVDRLNGDFRLASNSPCINSGYNNSPLLGLVDFAGNPRIVGGTVDLGAYEYQTPGSILSYYWAQQYGLPTDGSADFADPDGDGMSNWQEWIAGTNPTNAASVLKMLTLTNSTSGVQLTWQSVTSRDYILERSTNLLAQPAFYWIKSYIVGATNTTTYTDTTATNGGPYFYRVRVQ